MAPESPEPDTLADLPDQADLRERLARRLRARSPRRGHRPVGKSAVLVPIVTAPSGPQVLFTRRSEHLSAHPGEISYPGGRLQPSDDSARVAALRETREEVGIPPDAVDFVGHFTDYETYHEVLISGYVGLVDAGTELLDPTTPEEVTEHLLVPLASLMRGSGLNQSGDEPASGTEHLGRGYDVQAYEGRRLPDTERGGALLHYWHLDEASVIWGITGELTARWLETVFDWSPPSPPARAETLEDLRP